MDDTMRDQDGFFVLAKTYSELYEKSKYLTSLPYVQNRITEYDIRSANVSVLRRSHALRPEVLDDIEALPKHERQVTVGKIIREDKSIGKIIARGITKAKHDLFRSNIIQDTEVLSIKNDAVFIIGRRLKNLIFDEVEFRPKNVYALYFSLDGLEFYYDQKNDRVDIKGVGDDVLENEDHQNGMLRFFATVMRYLVYDRRDALTRYLIEFSEDYKNKRLPVAYYRELNRANIYRTHMELSGYSYNLEQVSEDDKPLINGIYNWNRYILPVIQIYL